MANTFKELGEVDKRKIEYVKYATELKEAILKDNIQRIKFYDEKGVITFIREDNRLNKPCDLCNHLERGDTLYEYSSWDGGINFDYIENIQYCPKCGRKLEEWKKE